MAGGHKFGSTPTHDVVESTDINPDGVAQVQIAVSALFGGVYPIKKI